MLLLASSLSSGLALPWATLSSCISAIIPAGLDYHSLLNGHQHKVSIIDFRTLSSFKKSLQRIDLIDLLADA